MDGGSDPSLSRYHFTLLNSTYSVAVAAGIFDGVEGLVGLAEELLNSCSVGRVGGDADG